MTTSTTPKNEERTARDHLKAIERARAANAKTNARRRADHIRDELVRSAPRTAVAPSRPPARSSSSARSAPDAPRPMGSARPSTAIRRRLGT